MFGNNHLGPLEITCDAPAYKVVQACRRVGIESPEDVRWCRLSEFLQEPHGWKGLFHPVTWKRLLAGGQAGDKPCSCGTPLPRMDRVTFTFTTGSEVTYFVGQCRRCRGVFWDEA